jgi:23S rRNA (uracil-5-)-methyltransferase RumA
VEDFRTALKSLQHIFEEKKIAVDSLYLLHNSGRADIVQGEFELISGNPTITEKLFDLTFDISPRSFFQTNTLGAEVLYKTTQDLIQTKNPIIFDLYAGTGTIGMIVAKQAQKVYSVEIVASASEDNIRNLEKNGLTNVEVINAPVENFLKQWKQEGNKTPDVIIIDPPRAGMHPDAPDIIRQFSPAEIIYVSCNPATLARDLVILCGENEYTLTDVASVDMFPHTHHIETVVRLQKNKT